MLRSQLSQRDQEVIQAVHDFGQLTSNQIQRLFFADGSEKSRGVRARRTLARLTKWQEVTRIEERAIGGWASGSHGYVYMPPTGQAQIRNPHTLAVAEFYVCLVEAQREGKCEILDYELEANIRGLEAIPDLYVRLRKPDGTYRLCLELDKSTESKQRIEKKLRAYIKSYDNWHGATFPQVIFAVSTQRQLKMIQRQIEACSLPELFQAADFDTAVTLCTQE